MWLECWTRSGYMLKADWRPTILSGWKIQHCSTHAAPDFWELTMTIWSSALFRADRTRRSSNGALPGAESRAKKKFPSGMPFFPNAAGGMKRATSWQQPGNDRVWAIATIFKRGWTCTTLKKAERRGDNFVPGPFEPRRPFAP